MTQQLSGIELLDVNGKELRRGDYVVSSDAMQLDDPKDYGIGVGQIEHIFTDGRRKGYSGSLQDLHEACQQWPCTTQGRTVRND